MPVIELSRLKLSMQTYTYYRDIHVSTKLSRSDMSDGSEENWTKGRWFVFNPDRLRLQQVLINKLGRANFV